MIMKTKEELLREAFSDIMYSTKTIMMVLDEVYEYGFANGFKQGKADYRRKASLHKSFDKEETR